MGKNLSPKDIVKARCARCHETENHTVIEVVDERTVRMECNSCRAISSYRGKKTKTPAKRASGGKARLSAKSQAAQAAAEREEWASLRPGMRPEKAVTYCMDGTYHARDVLEHPMFGLGLVTREAGPHKIEVLFEEGKKLLCCH